MADRENGGGGGARESLHWGLGGRRRENEEPERRRATEESESSARRLEDGERGFGFGIFGGRGRDEKGDVSSLGALDRMAGFFFFSFFFGVFFFFFSFNSHPLGIQDSHVTPVHHVGESHL